MIPNPNPMSLYPYLQLYPQMFMPFSTTFMPRLFNPNLLLSNLPIKPIQRIQIPPTTVEPTPIPVPVVEKVQQPASKSEPSPVEKEDSDTEQKKGNRKWDDDCDRLLLDLGVKYKHDWKKIAKRIYNVTRLNKPASYLRNRYSALKNSTLKENKKYSHEEDLKIAAAIKLHEKDWIEIAKYFKDRSPTSIRNRYYYSILRKSSLDKLMQELEALDIDAVLGREPKND